MGTRLLSLLLAAGLAGCDVSTAEDYRVFVEEDCLVVSSVEAALAFPAALPEQKI